MEEVLSRLWDQQASHSVPSIKPRELSCQWHCIEVEWATKKWKKCKKLESDNALASLGNLSDTRKVPDEQFDPFANGKFPEKNSV